MRFIMIDKLTSLQKNKSATAIKNIALSEDFFEDHFPLRPIMPGVLLIEGMAQLAGLLLSDTAKNKFSLEARAIMTIVNQMKFRKTVFPGEQIEYRAEISQINEFGGIVNVKTYRKNGPINGRLLEDGVDELIAEGSITFAFYTEKSNMQTEKVNFLLNFIAGDLINA